MSIRISNLVYLFLTGVVAIGGYFFLRLAYRVTDTTPFTQEIVLIILGVVATVLITALLLNKQTEVELRKEQSVKFIELKSEVYLEFLAFIEELLTRGVINEGDLVRMQFFSHKLAIIASPPVLEEYHAFLRVVDRTSSDRSLTEDEGDDIQRALARLTLEIRADLVGEVDAQQPWTIAQIREQIIENTDQMID